jgi:hypothetical protein
MQAKFFAVGSFFIRSRNMFVAVGDIIEGHIEPGMAVAVSLGSISVSTKVKEVEVIGVDFRDKEYMGLVFGFEDPEDLEFWQALKIGGETLELSA